MNTADRAVGGTGFDRIVFAFEVFRRVLGQRNSRRSALLRTVVDQPVFTNVQIPATGMAMPVVRQAFGEIILELTVVDKIREFLFAKVHDCVVNRFLRRTQRTKLATLVVDDAYGAVEAEVIRASSNDKGI